MGRSKSPAELANERRLLNPEVAALLRQVKEIADDPKTSPAIREKALALWRWYTPKGR
jgi:hypothetical protein